MPNWTYNTIICSKRVADETTGKDKDDKIIFDFNNLVPMPEELMIEHSSNGMMQLVSIFARSEDDDTRFAALETYSSMNPFFTKDQFEADLVRYLNEPEKFSNTETGWKYIMNRIHHGFATWYTWRTHKWGTKWEACNTTVCESEDEPNKMFISFDTAWCIPEGIMEELFRRYPDEEIQWISEDEDYDGTYVYCNENGSVKLAEKIDRPREED